MTAFTYCASYDVKVHYWERSSRQHRGWLTAPGTCQARGDIGAVRPVTRRDTCVVHRAEDGKAYVWDDVCGSELDSLLALQAREEGMGQFRKHEVYEKVKEEVRWAVAGKGPIGSRLIIDPAKEFSR